MPLMLRLDLDGLTFGDLYRFADLARGAGLDEDELVGVERTDAVGNMADNPTLVADLGDTDGLVRPVMVDGRDARGLAVSLARELAQESDESDREPLRRLLAALRGEPCDGES